MGIVNFIEGSGRTWQKQLDGHEIFPKFNISLRKPTLLLP